MHTLANPDIRCLGDHDFYDLLINEFASISAQRQQFLMAWRFDCLSPKDAAKTAGYKLPAQAANELLRNDKMLRAAGLLSEKLRREHGMVSADWIVRKYRRLLDGAVADAAWGAARGILADIAKQCGHAPEDRINLNVTGEVKHAFVSIDPDDLKAIATLHQQVLEVEDANSIGNAAANEARQLPSPVAVTEAG